MRLPHLVSRIFDVPLMIDPVKARTILRALAPRLFGPDATAIAVVNQYGEPVSDEPSAALHTHGGRSRQQLQLVDGVAVIDVFGTLVHRASGLDAMSGLTGYNQLSAELDAALDDPAVRGILLRVDSPGGEVSGAFDFSDEIFAAREKKPLWAIAEDVAASAAYLIGSSAERLFVTQTGFTGSIGVLMLHGDFSEAEKAEGVKITEIFAGAHKIDFSQHRPLSDAGLAWGQGVVDETYAGFVEKVARNRGIATQAVRATEARVYLAAGGVERKLADAVSTADRVFAAMQEELSRASATVGLASGGGDMSKTKDEPTTVTAETPAQPTAADLEKRGAEAERARILKIDAITLPGYEQLAVQAKAEGMGPEAFALKQAEEQKKRAGSKLRGLREDEAALEVPEPGVSSGEGVEEATLAMQMVELNHKLRGVRLN